MGDIDLDAHTEKGNKLLGQDAVGDMLTLVTGDQIDLNVASTDPATGAITTADGSVLYPDGTIVHGTLIVLPSGNVVDSATGIMTLPDGTVVQAASQDPTAISQIQAIVAGGVGLVTQIASGVQQIIGAVSGNSTVVRPGYARLPNGQIRMPDGTVVTPTVMADGRLMLPNGTVLPKSFGSSSWGGLGLAALVALGIWAVSRRSSLLSWR